MPAVEHRAFFRALTVAFRRLADAAGSREALPGDAVAVGVFVTYLEEGGWLSAYSEDTDAGRRCRVLLEMAAGGGIPPTVTAEQWVRLRQWATSRLRAAECRFPDDSH